MLKIFKNKKILIFGNTGFVGSNMSLFLKKLGSEVIGYSDKNYKHIELLNKFFKLKYILKDIRNYNDVFSFILKNKPDVIINLSSQALVKKSYKHPKETYETNILGTLNILETLRHYNKKIVFLNITSDKCYKNKEQIIGYKEKDELNGFDPYSNSKSCVELITNTYKNCFFNLDNYNKNHKVLIATLRSGNILGMGDFGEDRLIPDIYRSCINKKKLIIRYPNAIRPWIFVLDTIMGYLQVGEKLLEEKKEFAEAWNFSSNYSDMISVIDLVRLTNKYIDIKYEVIENKEEEKETNLLLLDSSKARKLLNWKPLYDIKESIKRTIMWYKMYYENRIIWTDFQIDEYMDGINKINL